MGPGPRPPVFKPIEDLNIPEEGPSLIIPEETRRQVPLSSSYGVTLKPVTFAPITDLNLPDQAPQLVIPEETRRQNLVLRPPAIISDYAAIPSNEIEQEIFVQKP